MPATRRALALSIGLLALTLALPACKENGFSLRKKDGPLVATHVQVTRRAGRVLKKEDAARANEGQKLVLDLNSGRASFTDLDGRTYPTQIERGTLEDIRATVASRAWRVDRIEPSKKAEEVTTYALTVRNNEASVGQSIWSRPSDKTVPASLQKFEDLFARAARAARPLSEDVDLLR